MRGQLPIPLEARARYRLALRQSIGSAAISMGNRWSRGIRSNRTAARSHEAFPRREAIILFERLSENQSRILMPRGTKSRRTSRGRKRERKRGDGKGGTVKGGKKREETWDRGVGSAGAIERMERGLGEERRRSEDEEEIRVRQFPASKADYRFCRVNYTESS